MRVKKIISNTKKKMKKTVERLKKELRGIRTGRASAALLEGIRVDYYGSKTPINQLANISIPQPRLIEIKVWDENALKPLEKAIIASNLGLTPSVDGKVVRLQVPSLTSQRREELIKRINDITEDFKVEIRNIRRAANDKIKKLEKSGDISEDKAYRDRDKIQDLTDKYTEKLDELLNKKEKEIKKD
ncbi:MAG: ribosome recycling factor [Elusimicrobiota bacterium]